MPEPITAPMPSAIRLQTPSVRFNRWPSSFDASISASMLLVRNSWLNRDSPPIESENTAAARISAQSACLMLDELGLRPEYENASPRAAKSNRSRSPRGSRHGPLGHQ